MSNTTGRFVHDINRLISARKEQQNALEKVTIEPIVAVRGIGEANQPPKVEASGGIASPLTELPGRREYYPPCLIKSSDGLFAIEQQSLKKAAFTDKDGNEIVIEFSDAE